MKRKVVGILLVALPVPLLIMTTVSYSIVGFILGDAGEGTATLVYGIVNVFLGLLGLVGLVGVLIGIPLGTYLLVTAEKHTDVAATQPPAIPQEPPVQPHT